VLNNGEFRSPFNPHILQFKLEYWHTCAKLGNIHCNNLSTMINMNSATCKNMVCIHVNWVMITSSYSSQTSPKTNTNQSRLRVSSPKLFGCFTGLTSLGSCIYTIMNTIYTDPFIKVEISSTRKRRGAIPIHYSLGGLQHSWPYPWLKLVLASVAMDLGFAQY
jgi:hypothetical protein